jgi:hypothetical protein
MRLGDLEEAKKEPIKPRDPNWRDMEALRKSGAAGSHGDKTKTIPRKEKYKKISMEDQFQENIVSMNVPLLIRVLEYAREDAESDVDLHNLIEKAVSMGGEEPLTMKDYDSLVQKDLPAPEEPEEVKKEHSDIFKALEKVDETASPGATSAGNIATVNNPHIAIGDKKTRKKYGSLVGAMPNPPKAKMQKPSDNALDMKGTSIFGGTLKR